MKVAILQEMCSSARPSLDVIGKGNLIKVHQARSNNLIKYDQVALPDYISRIAGLQDHISRII